VSGPAPSATTSADRTRLRREVWLVLGVSLGQSAVYATLNLVATLTRGPLSEATATLNPSRSDREWLDATYQLLGIGFALVPVALALFLLAGDGPGVLRRIGLVGGGRLRTTLEGVGLTALIGLPGIGLYLVGRALGVTADVVTVPQEVYWWTTPVLVLAALQNGVLEEVLMIGYLFTRLRQVGWSTGTIIVSSALVRGSYHLYQGFGQALGNVVMGLVFGYWYHRTERLAPLVVAHTLLDVFAFVGMLYLGDRLGLR
jgi:membrane protease YdiL (CAAX protease family)